MKITKTSTLVDLRMRPSILLRSFTASSIASENLVIHSYDDYLSEKSKAIKFFPPFDVLPFSFKCIVRALERSLPRARLQQEKPGVRSSTAELLACF